MWRSASVVRLLQINLKSTKESCSIRRMLFFVFNVVRKFLAGATSTLLHQLAKVHFRDYYLRLYTRTLHTPRHLLPLKTRPQQSLEGDCPGDTGSVPERRRSGDQRDH